MSTLSFAERQQIEQLKEKSTDHRVKEMNELVLEYRKHRQRMGQAIFNAVSMVDPGLAKKLTGTIFDCFHDDKRVWAFQMEVFKAWGLR